MIKKISTIFIILSNLFFKNTYAQKTEESAQILHQNGQIYLVVLVLLTIFAGIIFLLIRIEKKLNKLESNNK
ncbi:MAG: hypothetical protein R2831_11985 [Chitinophagaceae bacterium]